MAHAFLSTHTYFILSLFYFSVKSINVGCLLPTAEQFFRSRELNEKYIPKDSTLEEYEFETCSGSNCFEFAPESKNHIFQSNLIIEMFTQVYF